MNVKVKSWEEVEAGMSQQRLAAIDRRFATHLIEMESSSLIVFENPSIRIGEAKTWMFGSLEWSSQEQADQLLEQMIEWAKSQKCEYLIGPMNGSSWYDYRVRVNSEKPLFLGESKLPEYVIQVLEGKGFEIKESYFSTLIENASFDGEIQDHQQLFFDELDINQLESELRQLWKLNQLAFSGSPFFTPISESDFIAKYLGMEALIRPEYTVVARDEGKIVGLAFGYKDVLNEGLIVFKTLVRHPDDKYNGLGGALTDRWTQKIVRLGHQKIMHAFMHKENKSLEMSTERNSTLYSEYHLYAKKLSS